MLAEHVVGAVPDVGGLLVAVADLVEPEEQAAVVRVQPVLRGLGGAVGEQRLAGRRVVDVVERLERVEVVLRVVRAG